MVWHSKAQLVLLPSPSTAALSLSAWDHQRLQWGWESGQDITQGILQAFWGAQPPCLLTLAPPVGLAACGIQGWGSSRMVWYVYLGSSSPGNRNLALPPKYCRSGSLAVSLHGNIPAWGYTSNNNMTFIPAMLDVVKHFPFTSFPVWLWVMVLGSQ